LAAGWLFIVVRATLVDHEHLLVEIDVRPRLFVDLLRWRHLFFGNTKIFASDPFVFANLYPLAVAGAIENAYDFTWVQGGNAAGTLAWCIPHDDALFTSAASAVYSEGDGQAELFGFEIDAFEL
jgi:hypothetical protein